MPKGPVHSRLHIIPEKPVSKIRPHKPRKKTIITSRNKQIKETEKAPLQTVITPGPKPKVQVTQVPTQKPSPLLKTEKQPPAMPKLQAKVTTPTKPKAPPPVPPEPTITSKPSKNTVATTGITLKPGQALSITVNGLRWGQRPFDLKGTAHFTFTRARSTFIPD